MFHILFKCVYSNISTHNNFLIPKCTAQVYCSSLLLFQIFILLLINLLISFKTANNSSSVNLNCLLFTDNENDQSNQFDLKKKQKKHKSWLNRKISGFDVFLSLKCNTTCFCERFIPNTKTV